MVTRQRAQPTTGRSTRPRVRKAKPDTSNPGRRALLPTSALSPAQAAERKRIADAKVFDSQFDPGKGRMIRQSVNAEVDLQTRPTLNEFDRQISKIRPQQQANTDQSRALYEKAAQMATADTATVAGPAGDFLSKLAASYSLKTGEDASAFRA
ncbi:MAG: hypothetical protein H0W36_12815, partial [Gemmatimonadetes bacterium]|nr:hypothetical protein [Gemmatimonadota bacterium]